MAGRKTFIDRDVFEDLVQDVGTVAGEPYEDVETIYGDLSRLVVAWLASSTTAEIDETYRRLTWKGAPNVRPIREAARLWMEKHHPERLARLDRRGE